MNLWKPTVLPEMSARPTLRVRAYEGCGPALLYYIILYYIVLDYIIAERNDGNRIIAMKLWKPTVGTH